MKKTKSPEYPKIPEKIKILKLSKNQLVFINGEEKRLVKGKSVELLEKILPYLDGKNKFEDIMNKTKLSKKEILKILLLLRKNNLIFEDISPKKKEKIKSIKFKDGLINFFLDNTNYREVINSILEIQNSSIALIEVGKTGPYLLELLLSLNLKKIKIIDDKKINCSDVELGIYSSDDLNKPRYEILKKHFFKTNSFTKLEFYPKNLKETIKNRVLNNVDLVVFCSDRPNDDDFKLLNRHILEINKPWISSRLYDNYGEVGPIVIPYKTACFECFGLRKKAAIGNLEEHIILEKSPVIKSAEYGNLKSYPMIIAGFTFTEIIKILTKNPPLTCNSVLSLDFKNYMNVIYPILKIPSCPACGKAD